MSSVAALPLIGDLVWLFYQDRFGIFRIFNSLVDDYRYKGKYPIKPDGDATSILERFIDDMNTRRWPRSDDRNSTYLRSLGWSLTDNKPMHSAIHVNHSFGKNFHRFIQLAVRYYGEKQVAVAIRGTTKLEAPPSIATEAAIKDTLDLLIKSFDHYEYGTNQFNVIRGIRTVAEGVAAIAKLRDDIGIPTDLDQPGAYIPAAYDILVLNRPVSAASVTRYTVHKDLSESSQELLNQLLGFRPPPAGLRMDETIGPTNRTRLSLWLDNVEPVIEKYRTAYKAATGVDLGKITTAETSEQVISELRV